MWGSHVAALAVDIREQGQVNWTQIWRRNGQDTPNRAESVHDRWVNHGEVSFRSFEGNVQLRFRGQRGTGVAGDIALDDIRIVCSENSVGSCMCEDGYTLNASGACAPNLVTALMARNDTSAFLELLEMTDLMDTLSSGGPFTLFVPTDQALRPYLEKIEAQTEEVRDLIVK